MGIRKLKTLLINPPQTYYQDSTKFSKSFPLGLAYVAGMLDSKGYHVEILDTLFNSFEVNNLEKDIKIYGMSYSNIKKEITKRNPDVVGIAAPFTAQAENALRVSKIVKEINENIITVIGGPDASVRAEEILKQSKSFDFAVIREGEYTMLELVETLESNNLEIIEQIPGLAYRKNENIHFTPNRSFNHELDDLPLPAYHLFDMDAYLNANDEHLYAQRWGRKKKEIPMFTSRGCPFNCCFCSIHLHMGKKLRVHSAKQVLEHITHVTQKYGVNHIHFEDDNLTFPKKRFVAILDGIINNGLNFTWDTPNGIRADNLGKNILTKMKQSGCVHLTIAPESGVQSVLNNIINKRLELSEVIETAKHAKEVGLPLHAFFVVGLPGETILDMKKTMDFAEMLQEKFDVTPGISVATPLYGTRLHRECEEKGYLLSELTPKTLSESTQGKGIIKTEDFDPEDIKFLIEKADNKRLQLKLEKHSKKIKQQFRKYGIAGKLIVILWLSPRFSYIRTILKPLKKRFRKSSFAL